MLFVIFIQVPYLSIILKYGTFDWRIMDFTYSFPVVKGVQAGSTYFTAMVPLRMLNSLFGSADGYVPPEYRAQRRLNQSRIPEIRNYILNNRNTYVFSALAASIDGEMEYLPSSSSKDLGVLHISMDAKFLINDGQHRIAAILEAIQDDNSLLKESIPVVLFEDKGLERSQQMFTDLNKHAVRTSNSIAELYDCRDPLAVLSRETIKAIPFLNEFTDKEKDILGKNSPALFTLNMFYKANKRIVGRDELDNELSSFITQFWTTTTKYMIPWQDLRKREISKRDVKEKSISAQAVFIQSLGKLACSLKKCSSDELDRILSNLADISWSRSDDAWFMRTIGPTGRVLNSDKAISLTASKIKIELGIPLSNDEAQKEAEYAKEVEGRVKDADKE